MVSLSDGTLNKIATTNACHDNNIYNSNYILLNGAISTKIKLCVASLFNIFTKTNSTVLAIFKLHLSSTIIAESSPFSYVIYSPDELQCYSRSNAITADEKLTLFHRYLRYRHK